MADQPGGEHPHAHAEEDEEQNQPEQRDQADRPHRQRRDAVDGEAHHFLQRVLSLAVQSRQAVELHRRGPETELHHQAAQEHVHLAELRERARGAVAHQAEVGVVRDDVGT